jgi:hypothetical protein
VLRLYGHQRMHDEVQKVQRSRNCRRNPSSWVRGKLTLNVTRPNLYDVVAVVL